MGFLQITLRALIEESNILLQMWDQNNKGHTERIQELVELGGYKEGKKISSTEQKTFCWPHC